MPSSLSSTVRASRAARRANQPPAARPLSKPASGQWRLPKAWEWLRSWTVPWPLPAVLAWGASWLVWRWMLSWSVHPGLALVAGCVVGLLLAWPCNGSWRRALAGLGFPLAALISGWSQPASSLWWLLPTLPLLLIYPLRAWRDAPLFPTPAGALRGLPEVVGQPARVLDAGCGLGHGLRELEKLWPQAELHGVEWSPLLVAWMRLRRNRARVSQGDMWARSWADFDLVYLFQRPETMPRAWAKAQREMRPGSWLVSLEFAVPGVQPQASLNPPGQRGVWIYQLRAASSDSTEAVTGR